MMPIVVRALATLLGVLLAACLAPTVPPQPDNPPLPEDPPRLCTQIGCESYLLFELDVDLQPGLRYELEACVDGECTSETIVVDRNGFSRSGAIGIDAHRDTVGVTLFGDDYSGRHQVSLTVIGGPGGIARMAAEGIEFERVQPNGPGCEPVCWQAIVR